ncbi:MAG: hypothetical protein QGG98_04150 [Pseudomonadales bacterium]|nr:hypothetical protein [Pseudomonadales bacterium]
MTRYITDERTEQPLLEGRLQASAVPSLNSAHSLQLSVGTRYDELNEGIVLRPANYFYS